MLLTLQQARSAAIGATAGFVSGSHTERERRFDNLRAGSRNGRRDACATMLSRYASSCLMTVTLL